RPTTLVVILAAPAWLVDFRGRTVDKDLRAVLNAVEVHFDDAALPIRGHIKLAAIEPGGVVGLVVGGWGKARHFPVAGDFDVLPLAGFFVIGLEERLELLRIIDGKFF